MSPTPCGCGGVQIVVNVPGPTGQVGPTGAIPVTGDPNGQDFGYAARGTIASDDLGNMWRKGTDASSNTGWAVINAAGAIAVTGDPNGQDIGYQPKGTFASDDLGNVWRKGTDASSNTGWAVLIAAP